MRAHWPGLSDPARLERLRRRLGAALTLDAGPLRDDVDVLIAGRPEPTDLARCTRALVVPFAGLPESTRDQLRLRPDLAVYNLHHNAAAVAELAVGLVLAASKLLLPMDRALRQHDWRPRYAPDPSLGLAGARAVVLGHGAIGRRVGAALGALGMEVAAVRRRPEAGEHGPDALDALLPTARVVVVAVPLTEATRGLLDARRLGLLPEPAVLVNVGRAAVVDEEALWEALSAGRLRAGLDVWYRYPGSEAERVGTAPSRFPLETLDTVVLSPHRAGHGPHVEVEREAHLASLLATLAAGDEPASRVDVDAGY